MLLIFLLRKLTSTEPQESRAMKFVLFLYAMSLERLHSTKTLKPLFDSTLMLFDGTVPGRRRLYF